MLIKWGPSRIIQHCLLYHNVLIFVGFFFKIGKFKLTDNRAKTSKTWCVLWIVLQKISCHETNCNAANSKPHAKPQSRILSHTCRPWHEHTAVCGCVLGLDLGSVPGNRGKRDGGKREGESLILHLVHVVGGRQLTFSADTLGWATTAKWGPFQRTTWNGPHALKLFN